MKEPRWKVISITPWALWQQNSQDGERNGSRSDIILVERRRADRQSIERQVNLLIESDRINTHRGTATLDSPPSVRECTAMFHYSQGNRST